MSAGALTGVRAVARLELAEVLRSRWIAFSVVTYAALAAVFILAGLRESGIFGFTGSGRALVALTHALLVLIPLLALMAVGQVVTAARSDGTLELLLSQPLTRDSWFVGVSAVRFAVVLVPLAAMIAVIAGYGRLAQGDPVPWLQAGRCLAVTASLAWAFLGLGLLVSTIARSQARAVIWLLLLWVLGVALLDFALAGLMLQWRLNPQTVFTLAALNPVQAARMALLASADAELAVLGPVGFYLSSRIGAPLLTALGIAWPAVVGTASWLVALARFRRDDLV